MNIEQRPREKALRFGLESLTNLELIALILQSGNKKRDVFDIAKDNLRVQTQQRTFFRGEKTQDLQSWINANLKNEAMRLGVSTDLFDSENNLNVELAKAVFLIVLQHLVVV